MPGTGTSRVKPILTKRRVRVTGARRLHVSDDLGRRCDVAARCNSHSHVYELHEEVHNSLLLDRQPLVQCPMVVGSLEVALEEAPATILTAFDLQLQDAWSLCRHDIPVGLGSSVLHSHVVTCLRHHYRCERFSSHIHLIRCHLERSPSVHCLWPSRGPRPLRMQSATVWPCPNPILPIGLPQAGPS